MAMPMNVEPTVQHIALIVSVELSWIIADLYRTDLQNQRAVSPRHAVEPEEVVFDGEDVDGAESRLFRVAAHG